VSDRALVLLTPEQWYKKPTKKAFLTRLRLGVGDTTLPQTAVKSSATSVIDEVFFWLAGRFLVNRKLRNLNKL